MTAAPTMAIRPKASAKNPTYLLLLK